MKARICLSTLLWEHCCCGSFGSLEVFLLRVGCLSATGSFPSRGLLLFPIPFVLSLSNPDRDEEDFLLFADNDNEDEDEDEKEEEDEDKAAAEPPFMACGAAFLFVLGELLGVLGIALLS